MAGIDPNYISYDNLLCSSPLQDFALLNLTEPEARLNPATGKCFQGYKPCSRIASKLNTICVPSDADVSKACPLTDVQFVDSFASNSDFSPSYKRSSLAGTGIELQTTQFSDRGPISSHYASEETPCLIAAENKESCDLLDSRFVYAGLTLTLYDITQLTADERFGKIDFYDQVAQSDKHEVQG